MQENINVIAPGTVFRHVFILESRDWWPIVDFGYDASRDLVLTYDFGLKRDVEAIGGTVRYVDHLCEQAVMHENNFRMYRFFRDWHLDAEGADIFRYRDVDFGFSFRIEIWNDFTFYVRNRLCLEQLRTIGYTALFVGSGQDILDEILSDMGMPHEMLKKSAQSSRGEYFFPIHRWMDERLRGKGLRPVLRDAVLMFQGIAMSWYDRLASRFRHEKRVFVQEYHPTRELLQRLKRCSGVKVVQGHFSAARGVAKFLHERPIPVYGRLKRYRSTAQQLHDSFVRRREARLILSTGVDITDAVNRVIEGRLFGVMPRSLRTLHCVIRYLEKLPISLEILIANVGQVAMLVDSVAKSRGVPSYLIINGLMVNEFLDEAKYASVINAYSTSIRDNYFRGMDNIVCLGDPRMDVYARQKPRAINRKGPTVTIGASGFNNIDLNSYVAVEFEYLSDVLSAIGKFKLDGRIQRVILKIRPNGYLATYRQFIDEYFPGVVDSIVDNAPLKNILDDTDLLISLHSQVLFEASCLGIPSVYHKNDCEIIDPPFNGKSELVTTYDAADLERAIGDFLEGSNRFDAFLEKSVMEKYIGPLDGMNLERNLNFVQELLTQRERAR